MKTNKTQSSYKLSAFLYFKVCYRNKTKQTKPNTWRLLYLYLYAQNESSQMHTHLYNKQPYCRDLKEQFENPQTCITRYIKISRYANAMPGGTFNNCKAGTSNRKHLISYKLLTRIKLNIIIINTFSGYKSVFSCLIMFENCY